MEELQLSQKVLWHVVVISLHWTAFLFISPYSPRSIFSTAHNLEILLAHTVSPVSFHLSLLRVFQILWIWDVFIPLVHLHICLNFRIFYFYFLLCSHPSILRYPYLGLGHTFAWRKQGVHWVLIIMVAVLCRKGFMGLFLGLGFFSFSFSFWRNNSTGSPRAEKARQKSVLL